MNKQRYVMIGLALTLAGVLLLAGAGWAQNRAGGGAGPGGPGSQLCTPGPGGVCAVGPTNPANQQNCGYGAGKSRKAKGKGRRAGQANQPAAPVEPPAATQ